MRKDLIVLGAGGGAGDIVSMLVEINQQEDRWNLIGFLDDDPAKHGTAIAGWPVLGSVAEAPSYPNCKFVIGVAHYRRRSIRKTIFERLSLPLAMFATLIHPRASVSHCVSIGAGTLIFENAVVCDRASIGNHVFISPLCYVGHHALVEDCGTMAPGSIVCGSSRVCAGSYLGASSAIADGVTVGENALVGMGAVVIQNVKPNEFVAGNPARVVAESPREERLREEGLREEGLREERLR